MSQPIYDFTTIVPHWRPRVTPIKLEDATPNQLEALKVTPSNTKVSDYVLVLARDSETLRERTPLFNASCTIAVGCLAQNGNSGPWAHRSLAAVYIAPLFTPADTTYSLRTSPSLNASLPMVKTQH